MSVIAITLFMSLTLASYTCQNISSIAGIAETDTYYVTNAKSVAANYSTNSSAYCDVKVVIGSRINSWVRLPDESHWNGRFVQYGCGGACGYNPFDIADAAFGGPVAALKSGYAVSTTDMGVPSSDSNYLPFHNNFQMRIDWGYLATHLTCVVSKEIMTTYYSAEPSFSYHLGGSTGGRQGLVEAQRYPEDFDGIVAVAPSYNETGVTTYQITWNAQSTVTSNSNDSLTPVLTAADASLIHSAVIAACDHLDGLVDGIISLPRSCHFNLSSLLCPTGTTNSSSSCLSKTALIAAEHLYSGPVSNTGTRQVLEGLLPGSEAVWNGSYISTSASTAAPWYSFAASFLSYYAFWPDPPTPIAPSEFNLSDPELLRKTSKTESLEYGGVADITKFQQLGGKIIMFQGLIDTAVAPWFARDYYERVGKAMGEACREGFVRFFEMPGVEHVSGGPGADTYDSLTLIADWIEKGKVPNKVIAAHYDDDDQVQQFTRPLFPFPQMAKYKGFGDVSVAESFIAVDASESFWAL